MHTVKIFLDRSGWWAPAHQGDDKLDWHHPCYFYRDVITSCVKEGIWNRYVHNDYQVQEHEQNVELTFQFKNREAAKILYDLYISDPYLEQIYLYQVAEISSHEPNPK